MKYQRWCLVLLFIAIGVLTLFLGSTGGAAASVVAQQISPLTNDFFVDATAIDTLPFQSGKKLILATLEPDEPNWFCNDLAQSVWYRFTATSNALLTLTPMEAISRVGVQYLARNRLL